MTALRSVPDPDPGLALRTFPVTSDDGTRLVAWTNADDGWADTDLPTVLLCNGLGTNPYAWPALLERDCGVRVVSWNHRGVGGSDRPLDRHRVGQEVFVEDAVAVLDAVGLESAVLAGWSIGVNTAFELAVTHPERVRGIFAVGGVPGDTFGSVLAPLHVPRALGKPFAISVAHTLRLLGVPLWAVASRLPLGPRAGRLITHSGFMLPVPDEGMALRAIREFLTTPTDWYMHLALASALHTRVSLSGIDVPTAFVAGTYDVLAAAADMRSAAARIPGATYVELPSSHFLPLEKPEQVHRELVRLLERVG